MILLQRYLASLWRWSNADVPASRTLADAIRHLSGSKPRRVEGE